MNAKIYDITELTDSRELLESKPHPFVPIFITLLVVIIVVALIWSYFGEIDMSVKASGIVRPNEKVSAVESKILGNVEDIYFINGEKVQKGDLLFTLKKDDLEVQKKALIEELDLIKTKLDQLELFKKSIQNKKNYFSTSEEDRFYYEEYEKYQADYQKLKADLNYTEINLRQSKQELTAAQLEVKRQIEQEKLDEIVTIKGEQEEVYQLTNHLRLLEQSILQNENFMTDTTNKYYTDFISYQTKMESYKNMIEEKQQDFERKKQLGEAYIAKVEIEAAKRAYDNAVLEMETYKSEFLLSLRSQIKSYEEKLRSLENEKNNLLEKEQLLNSEINLNSELKKITLVKFERDKQVELNQSIEQYEMKKQEIENQINTIEAQIQDRLLKAPIDGVVNSIREINVGELVQPGEEIVTIVPMSETEFKVDLSVPNKDISKIKIGDEIKYHFLALPYKEYGEVKGKITKINTDATTNPQTGQSYYKVEAAIESKPLYSYKGEEAQIKVGMSSEAYIVTDSKKILYFLLEKINLKE